MNRIHYQKERKQFMIVTGKNKWNEAISVLENEMKKKAIIFL